MNYISLKTILQSVAITFILLFISMILLFSSLDYYSGTILYNYTITVVVTSMLSALLYRIIYKNRDIISLPISFTVSSVMILLWSLWSYITASGWGFILRGAEFWIFGIPSIGCCIVCWLYYFVLVLLGKRTKLFGDSENKDNEITTWSFFFLIW